MTERIANRSGHRHCKWCCDDGWVSARIRYPVRMVDGVETRAIEHPIDEMGPCPACEKGFAIEFGQAGSKLWPGGFWKGEPWGDHVKRTCTCSEPAVSAADAKEMIGWMFPHISAAPPAPPAEAEIVVSAPDAAVAVADPPAPERVTPGEGEHLCPAYTPNKVVPWTIEDCAMCTPAQPLPDDELTL